MGKSKFDHRCDNQHVHHIFPLSRNSTMNGSLADSAGFGEPLPSYYTSHPVEAERDADALIHSYIDENLAIVRRGKIAQPVCLPQIERGFDMPVRKRLCSSPGGSGHLAGCLPRLPRRAEYGLNRVAAAASCRLCRSCHRFRVRPRPPILVPTY